MVKVLTGGGLEILWKVEVPDTEFVVMWGVRGGDWDAILSG